MGLPIDESTNLGERFYTFCDQYRPAMRTKTHDTSAYGVQYVSGLLRLEEKRNMTQISRRVGAESQNMQQFISDSPWPGPGLIQAVQSHLKAHPIWEPGAVLVIDESADEKAGESSVGASRQHNVGDPGW